MNRRNFISKAVIVAVSVKTIIVGESQAARLGVQFPAKSRFPSKDSAFDTHLLDQVKDFFDWLQSNGWFDVIKKLSPTGLVTTDPLNPELFKTIHPQLGAVQGCDDFSGTQLIAPGSPAKSLIYHLCASPRVRLDGNKDATFYPSLEQIDLLENYIYSLDALLAKDYKPTELVLAVFAYEYRPACKTPHEFYADMVYSRSGFSRIGTQPVSTYDRINRCFTNLPDDPAKEKEIAVTPARYALFLARRVSVTGISNNDPQLKDEDLEYLIPVRKLFKDDIYLSGYDLFFSESHLNEKLRRLCQQTDMISLPANIFDEHKPPFIYRSSSSTNPNRKFDPSYDTDMVHLKEKGSSVLLSSAPSKKLTERAFQKINGENKRLRIQIPEYYTNVISDQIYSNRRYTTLKMLPRTEQYLDAINVIKDHVLHPNAIRTEYKSPRNAPMFVYIRERMKGIDGNEFTVLNETGKDLFEETKESAWVGLFEDKICDGCIMGDISLRDQQVADQVSDDIKKMRAILLACSVLPAFSVVTAPDFFPIVESYDMKEYKKLFLSGGVQDISGARLKANPNIHLPGSEKSAFPSAASTDTENAVQNTILAIVSKPRSGGSSKSEKERVKEANSQTRSNYMPDSATLIFFPGWDITYSDIESQSGEFEKLYYSTMSLGSPFMEDSKLCAAANGMWAAASPDAARTFRGTLDVPPFTSLTPTAVPLLDIELGYHPQSPGVIDHKMAPSTGWDGEQGPFFQMKDNCWFVNFTDIKRSDYVQNAIRDLFDMSQMRKITVADIRLRMDALDRCYKKLRLKNPKPWLVGAENVINWSDGALGLCLPKSILDNADPNFLKFEKSEGKSGQLYAFVETYKKNEKDENQQLNDTPEAIEKSKRMLQKCKAIYICQVSEDNYRSCKLNAKNNWVPKWT